MTTLWSAILIAAAVSLTIKAAGATVLGERELPGWLRGVVALLAPTLLSALVVVDVLGPRWATVNWPLVGGLAAVTGAKLLRAPMLLAVICGIAATALLRLATS
jgi:branched-subunit amino acid transport protein